jgi:hypothetical protein
MLAILICGIYEKVRESDFDNWEIVVSRDKRVTLAWIKWGLAIIF